MRFGHALKNMFIELELRLTSADKPPSSLAVPSPPGAPEILASGMDFATIEWLKPESDGGSPILHFLVERREKKSARWVKVNRDGTLVDSMLKVSDLTEGNIYQFRVTAINKAGEGEASEVSLYVICRVPTCKCLQKKHLIHFWRYICSMCRMNNTNYELRSPLRHSCSSFYSTYRGHACR